ncbi:MAG: phenylalanine--tRNA ligase subunit alpha [Candidatus Magasanikbacteria bacterium]|jgi:phenylalanyl-tRNA synthetase alpha chain|nr:phenylalanine--tRNA ligase subunit alpha [Candidatus Magasanikbacteria bacterium]
MKEQLQDIKKEFDAAIGKVMDFLMLEELEKEFFGRKSGKLSLLMKEMKGLSGDVRKGFGQMANEVKQELETMLCVKKEVLEKEKIARIAQDEAIDITQPYLPKKEHGHIHPITQARWQLEETARTMGMRIEDGPELESDYFIFGSLNFPDDHPARESMDTFYIKDHKTWCMRPHVSNMQVRMMQKYGAPLRVAHPGRVYRNEALDATHGHTFYQFDVLIIDKELSIGNLTATITTLLQGFFNKDIEVRLRPAHFPFVEPGFEADMKISYKAAGKEKEKWMEIVGCGMVHPNVIKEGGLDPKEWKGLAFSFGIDRLVMSKYGIEDLRHIHSGDLRFLKQF